MFFLKLGRINLELCNVCFLLGGEGIKFKGFFSGIKREKKKIDPRLCLVTVFTQKGGFFWGCTLSKKWKKKKEKVLTLHRH